MDNLTEMGRMRANMEEIIKKKDVEISTTSSKLEAEEMLNAGLERKNKELQVRIEELEEELETERALRAKPNILTQMFRSFFKGLSDKRDLAHKLSHISLSGSF
ncbi:putative uncharacterized protein MYH16 isoform X1 [Triplophysa rosa]|nr:putative uncharacterized protein MYH16 isoform X1 [Triplophysa rosa]